MKVDLEDLLSKGLIDLPTADKIKAHYASLNEASPGEQLIRIVSITGAILIGLGLILIVGYNWYDFPKSVRLILAFLPLGLSQALGFFSIINKKGTVWQECSAVSILLTVGLAMILVSQIYFLQSSIIDLLKWWILLSWPLLFVFNAGVSSLLLWGGIGIYTSQYAPYTEQTIWSTLFICIALWVYLYRLRSHRDQQVWQWHHWMIPLVLLIYNFSLGRYTCQQFILVQGMILLLVFYWADKQALVKSRFVISGFRFFYSVGTLLVAFILSFKSFWSQLVIDYSCWSNQKALFILFPFGVTLIYTLYTLNKSGHLNAFDWPWLITTLIPLLLLVGYLGVPGVLISNFILLGIMAFLVYEGITLKRLLLLNAGLVLLTIWIICRFFEYEISFLWKGLLFILLGLLCLLLNLRLLKSSKA